MPSSEAHPLGTDHLGRDILTRIVYGARNTISIAFVTTLLSFVIGSVLGFTAATLGGLDRPVPQPAGRCPDGLSYANLRPDGAIRWLGTSVSALILTIALLGRYPCFTGFQGRSPWTSR